MGEFIAFFFIVGVFILNVCFWRWFIQTLNSINGWLREICLRESTAIRLLATLANRAQALNEKEQAAKEVV